MARLSSPELQGWEHLLEELPKLAATGRLRELMRRRLDSHNNSNNVSNNKGVQVSEQQAASAAGLCSMDPSETRSPLHGAPATELWRAYTVLSFLAHAYLWCEHVQSDSNSARNRVHKLPHFLAKPWVAVARAIDMPPVLTYATYNLLNWRCMDSTEGVQLGRAPRTARASRSNSKRISVGL